MFGNTIFKNAEGYFTKAASDQLDVTLEAVKELAKLTTTDWRLVEGTLYNKVRGACFVEGVVCGLACAGVACVVNKTIKKYKEET